jgi:hypothetical protein
VHPHEVHHRAYAQNKQGEDLMGNNKSFHDSWINFGAPKKSNSHFNQRHNGTNIFGVKAVENRPGHNHGHTGKNFHRTPHSTIGSAAIGRPHNYNTHKNNTFRW